MKLNETHSCTFNQRGDKTCLLKTMSDKKIEDNNTNQKMFYIYG